MIAVMRMLALASFPLIDLWVATQFARALETDACTSVFCAEAWITYANIVASWAMIYAVLYWIAHLARRTGKWFLRVPVVVLLFAAFLALAMHGIFSWSFIVTNGFPPSPDALQFLILNAARVPQHVLQTSPVLGTLFAALVLGLAAAMTWALWTATVQPAGPWPAKRTAPPKAEKHALRKRIAVTAASFLLVALSAPYAGANVSAVAVNKLVAKRLNPFAAGLAPDPALARTFTPSKPYVPARTHPAPGGEAAAPNRGPVIVILVESLRRDLIEMEPSPVPFLKDLAQQDGIFFDKAYATASHSNYADVAFWYSRYPMRSLGLQTFEADAPERGLSLFAAFRRHHYETAYISSQNELWGGMIRWLESEVDHFFHAEHYDGETWLNADDEKGMDRLIRKGIATAGKIEDSETLRIAKRWIDDLQGRRDFMLGMNLQNTHFSYVYPPDGKRPHRPDTFDFPAIYYSWPEAHKETVRNRYLNAVTNVDRLLAGFAAHLKKKGLWDDATFVVVGDSGEAFHEHGFGNHSGPMYDEAMRTFAMIKPPGHSSVPRGRFDAAISHLDIAPSVLGIAGLAIPGSFQGRTVFEVGPRPPVYMHTNAIVKQNGIVMWPWKLLHTYYPYERLELYNLENDPGEHRNLSAREIGTTDRLSGALDLWIRRQLLYYSDPAYFTRYDPPR